MGLLKHRKPDVEYDDEPTPSELENLPTPGKLTATAGAGLFTDERGQVWTVVTSRHLVKLSEVNWLADLME